MYENLPPLPWCAWLLIIATCVASFCAFWSFALEEKYIFNPEAILAGKEYYRLVTSAFLHADLRHLGFNMLSLFLFGRGVELALGPAQFLLIYFGAIIGGNLLSLYMHRHHEYRAYGASGGVCGIIFASILMHPGGSIASLYLPIPIPNWLYAIGFLLASFYGVKEQNRGNVGHDAHLGGAIIGFLIVAALHPGFVRFNPLVFGLVLVISVALLIYLWRNPLLLPVAAFSGIRLPRRKQRPELPKHKRESFKIDAVLDKISRSGVESLSAEEKALLDEVSGKYQRRAQSSKPNSGLAI